MARLILSVDPARDHIQGPDGAAVTLVEYGDYECPYCGMAHPIVRSLQREFGDRLRFVFRHFPLTELHPHAEHAAEAAEAAAAQGRFWEMHDTLFAHQKHLGDSAIRNLAEGIGLDGVQISDAIQQHRFQSRVQEDFESGVESGVNGTPTFFINGVRFEGSWNDQAEFREAIAEEI